MLKLALRNVLRHRARTTMTLVAVVFGVVGLILSGGFVHDIFLQLGEAVIHSGSGHLQVSLNGYQAEGTRRPEQYVIKDVDALKARIAGAPGVQNVMARVSFSGLLNNGRSDVPVAAEGIEASAENALGTYISIVAGRRLTDEDANGAVIGNGVAKALKLRPGDRATLVTSTAGGAPNALDLDIVGVFQTFSKDYDARAVRVPLRLAQQVLDDPGANAIVVALSRTDDTAATAERLRATLSGRGTEVWTWRQLNDFYEKTVQLYQQQFGILRLIILIMVLLGVANSVNITVFERMAEFGTMRALGNSRVAVFALVTFETLALGVVGALVGVLLGAVLALAISAVGIPMPPPPNSDLGYTAQIRLVPSVFAGAFVAGVLATTVSGCIAGLRVSRVPVVDALRQVV